MNTLLIVEDDKNLRRLMQIKLTADGYQVLTAKNGMDALDKISKSHVDLALVDVNMPIMNGFELVKTLRDGGNLTPTIMITSRGTIADKEQGFLAGVDDYMVKPLDFQELSLRIKAVLRRAKIVSERKIKINDTVLDYETLTVYNETDKVTLTKKEFAILYKLLSYPERSFSKTALFEEFWSWDSDTEEDVVKVYVARIRSKIEPFSNIDVETVRGIGYRGIKIEDAK